MDTEYFCQRIQCSRDDKQECLRMVYLLADVAYTYRSGGIMAVDSLISHNKVKYSAVFLNRALQVFIDAKEVSQIRTVLYNCIIASNFSGRSFLSAVIITETLACLFDQEDLDYIFTFLVPSYFGMDYEDTARRAYQDYRKIRMMENSKTKS